MAESKRYYWLKLMDDFFDDKIVRKLGKLVPRGETIYLHMMQRTLQTSGIYIPVGLEEKLSDEIAFDIDEDPDDVERVIDFLLKYQLAEKTDSNSLSFPLVSKCTGSEAESTTRSRECRQRQKESELLQCNADATQMQRECNADATQSKSKRKKLETDKSKSEIISLDSERGNNGRNNTHSKQERSGRCDFADEPLSDGVLSKHHFE